MIYKKEILWDRCINKNDYKGFCIKKSVKVSLIPTLAVVWLLHTSFL
jgi:hypothetical protein